MRKEKKKEKETLPAARRPGSPPATAYSLPFSLMGRRSQACFLRFSPALAWADLGAAVAARALSFASLTSRPRLLAALFFLLP
jgi:hypothetical protein